VIGVPGESKEQLYEGPGCLAADGGVPGRRKTIFKGFVEGIAGVGVAFRVCWKVARIFDRRGVGVVG
jgi:hypothetical protein